MIASDEKAILSQPTIYPTIRGPRSRAGFSPAFVIGPTVVIMIETVKPIKRGAIFILGLPKFEPSVSEKITAIKINVPIPSANAATGILTTPFGVFGKILHQIADALLTMLISAAFVVKRCVTESSKKLLLILHPPFVL